MSRLRNRRQRGVLAQHGFDVTGIDFAPAALAKAAAKATVVGVRIRFIEDDLAALRHRLGSFDLLVDYGTLDDLSPADRARYVENVLPLAGPDARFGCGASKGRLDDWIAGCASSPSHRARWGGASATPLPSNALLPATHSSRGGSSQASPHT
jgi:SAM-dependent methyltransferase